MAIIITRYFFMYYVYIIQSLTDPSFIYAGYTTDIKQRLETHNSGGSIYTSKNRPWKLLVCLVFENESCAKEFEKYLKLSSGRAFIKKRFLI